MYIQWCLENYEWEDVIKDFQTLVSCCQKTQESTNMYDKIMHLYASLVIKIKKFQMEVDKSLGQFPTGAVPWLLILQVYCD